MFIYLFQILSSFAIHDANVMLAVRINVSILSCTYQSIFPGFPSLNQTKIDAFDI